MAPCPNVMVFICHRNITFYNVSLNVLEEVDLHAPLAQLQ